MDMKSLTAYFSSSPRPSILFSLTIPQQGQVLGPWQRSLGPLASRPNDCRILLPHCRPVGQSPQALRPYDHPHSMWPRRAFLPLGYDRPYPHSSSSFLCLDLLSTQYQIDRHAQHPSLHSLPQPRNHELSCRIGETDSRKERIRPTSCRTRYRHYLTTHRARLHHK